MEKFAELPEMSQYSDDYAGIEIADEADMVEEPME